MKIGDWMDAGHTVFADLQLELNIEHSQQMIHKVCHELFDLMKESGNEALDLVKIEESFQGHCTLPQLPNLSAKDQAEDEKKAAKLAN